MDIISLLLLVAVIAVIGYVAYWLITKFFPAGLPQTVALIIVGLLLLILLLTQTGLWPGAGTVLATPVTT